MRWFLMCLALGASLAACNTTRALSATDRAALTAHENQWAARSFHSYSFDYSEQQLGTSYNVHITVEDDTVATVVESPGGQPPAVPRTWPTIDALFSEADFAVQQGGITVSLEYDEQYGYPTLLSLQSNSPGGGFLARVSNLQPLQ
ncbi:MAG: hypothetical protein JJD97_05485 [Gemmatimonadaceae bacterium]|nr:hypothetical protein [Gemmatimonadaceae bacterium]